MYNNIREVKILKVLKLFFISMLPIVELKGSIPLGVAWGFSHFESFIISLFGNIIIVPFLLNVYYKFIQYLINKNFIKSHLKNYISSVIKKAEKIKGLQYTGLALFVAVPLPSTGVWTAALIAGILKLDKKKAFYYIALGSVVSAFTVLALTYGISRIF